MGSQRRNLTNSDEFASMFTKVIGTTSDGSAIESDNSID